MTRLLLSRVSVSRCARIAFALCVLWSVVVLIPGGEVSSFSPEDPVWKRIRAYLQTVPAIDTHNHLPPFDQLPGYLETEWGRGMNLASIWKNSYFTWVHPLTAWPAGGPFEEWWKEAQDDFENARAMGVYQYQLPAFRDLYGIAFETITDDEARELNRRIYENYQDSQWIRKVITEDANIELMLNDPWWGYLELEQNYDFEVLVLNVNPFLDYFAPDPARAQRPGSNVEAFAQRSGLEISNLGSFLRVIERAFKLAQSRGAVAIKTTIAYRRPLDFRKVDEKTAGRAFADFSRSRDESAGRDLQDFLMWEIASLSAEYELPFQIHTGLGLLEGSNPLFLMELIRGNPQTRFILFHGGFPWIHESGAVVMSSMMNRHPNVWLDSVWLPILSPIVTRRALLEWLEIMPSNRIMWGADCNHAEGVYGAAQTFRDILAETLTIKVRRSELSEESAMSIGRQILRENALEVFPGLRERLWKQPQ